MKRSFELIPLYHGKTLPPWTGDDDAMLHWLCDRLDENMWSGPELSKAELRAYLRESKKLQTPNELEIFFARRGDLGPLIKKHPDLEPFLALPKMERGKSFAQVKAKFSMDQIIFSAALKDLTAIRCVWKKHFNRSNRKRDERPAEWFAAKRWELYTKGKYKAAGLFDVLMAAKKR